jgi:uncharacterized protein YggU (UPF0235/DUF167 family)
MKILVKAKPHAKVEKVEELTHLPDSSHAKRAGIPAYKVSVRAAPDGGRANDAIIRALAKHFKVSANDIRIVSGHAAGQKIIEIGGRLL